MPCNPNQLPQSQYSQTSSGTASKVIFDRDTGKPIIIRDFSLNLSMTESDFSFTTSWQNMSQHKLVLLLRCLLIIQALPESALEEASEELEGIFHFYISRLNQTVPPPISVGSIQGKLKEIQVRPPIILEAETSQ